MEKNMETSIMGYIGTTSRPKLPQVSFGLGVYRFWGLGFMGFVRPLRFWLRRV